MPDPAQLLAILAPLTEGDRSAILEALAPTIARGVRRLARDAAIRQIADMLPIAGLSERGRAAAVSRELRHYATTRWRLDQGLSTMPVAYRDTLKAPLFAAFHAAGGRPPLCLSQIRSILRSWKNKLNR